MALAVCSVLLGVAAHTMPLLWVRAQTHNILVVKSTSVAADTCICCAGSAAGGRSPQPMSPVMAQGLNAGLEDMTIFTQLLEQHNGNMTTAGPESTRIIIRLPDIHALVMLNELLSTSDLRIEPQVRVISDCCQHLLLLATKQSSADELHHHHMRLLGL